MTSRTASAGRPHRLFVAALIAALPFAPVSSRAAAVRGRVLRGLETRAVPGATELHILFDVPIQYLRHTPGRFGTSIDVQLTPLAQGPGDALASLDRESLRPPAGADIPLVDVTYEGNRTGGSNLEVRFSRRVAFDVRQGRDVRSLVVTLPDPAAPQAPQAPERGAPAPGDAAQLEALMAAGRGALRDGHPDRAVQLFTRVLGLPENEHSAEARELLGNAREENGQLAHALAEYQEYLTRHPDGEGAERVRRRLAALLAGPGPAAPPLGEERLGPRLGLDHSVVGSISTHYRYDVRHIDPIGRLETDNSLYSDLYLSARLVTERFDLGGEVAGSYLADFGDDGSDRTRVNTLFVEVEDRGSPLFGSLGRQPGNTAGVTSRFDGASLGVHLNDTFAVTARAGYPANPFISDIVQTDLYFYGLSVDATDLLEGLDTQLYVLEQHADGFTDRTAVGGQFSYVRGRLFLAGMVDYDLHFSELSIGILTANWRATDTTSLNLLVDYRLTPLLSTRNALLGQTEDDLGDLRSLLPGVDLDDLAEDRTARSKWLTLDVTHQLSERFQIVGYLMVSELDGTPASGGALGFEGTGPYYSYLVQLIGNRLIMAGDVGRVALRYDDGRALQRTSLLVATRIPLGSRLRINPALTVAYGNPARGDSYTLYRPALRFDYRLGPVTFDAEASYEWVKGERFAGSKDESGYTLLLGARYDF